MTRPFCCCGAAPFQRRYNRTRSHSTTPTAPPLYRISNSLRSLLPIRIMCWPTVRPCTSEQSGSLPIIIPPFPGPKGVLHLRRGGHTCCATTRCISANIAMLPRMTIFRARPTSWPMMPAVSGIFRILNCSHILNSITHRHLLGGYRPCARPPPTRP